MVAVDVVRGVLIESMLLIPLRASHDQPFQSRQSGPWLTGTFALFEVSEFSFCGVASLQTHVIIRTHDWGV